MKLSLPNISLRKWIHFTSHKEVASHGIQIVKRKLFKAEKWFKEIRLSCVNFRIRPDTCCMVCFAFISLISVSKEDSVTHFRKDQYPYHSKFFFMCASSQGQYTYRGKIIICIAVRFYICIMATVDARGVQYLYRGKILCLWCHKTPKASKKIRGFTTSWSIEVLQWWLMRIFGIEINQYIWLQNNTG